MDLHPGTDLGDDRVMMTHELEAAGLSRRAISRMVADGRLHRLRHGAHTSHETWLGLDQHERQAMVDLAVLRSARSGSVLSHTSAARAYGAPVWDLPDLTHITRLDARAGRHEAGKIQHRGALLAEDTTVRHGVPMTSGTRTAIDVMSITDVEHALVVVNGLLHAGETTLDHLHRRLAPVSGHPSLLNAALVLRLASPLCTSAAESRTFHLCWRHHVPAPVLQHPVLDEAGRVRAYLDLAWPEHGVFLEVDGAVKYDQLLAPGQTVAQVVMREKEREAWVVARTGWRVIRLTWADLRHPVRTARRILAALDGRPVAA